MEYREYLSWIEYRNKNGPLNQGEHLSKSFAYIAIQFASAFMKKPSGRFEVDDFLIWAKTEVEDASPQQVFELLKQIATTKEPT